MSVVTVRGIVDQISGRLTELAGADLGYPCGDNRVCPPDVSSRRCDLWFAGLRSQSQFAEFYATCDGIDLPDVWNGLFLHGQRMLWEAQARQSPTRLRSGAPVTVFGSTGGGTLFAARVGPGPEVVMLSNGSVRDGAFDDLRTPVEVICDDLRQLLTRIVGDIDAVTAGRDDWPFLGR